MTYAILSDIEKELKKTTFTSSSIPTATAVEGFLEQADAIINMHLHRRYVTPILAEEPLKILKKIAIDFVTYRVAKIIDLSQSNQIPDSNIIQQIDEGSAYRESMKLLTAIRDSKMDLPSVDEINPTSGLGSFHTDNTEITPFFEKGVDQW